MMKAPSPPTYYCDYDHPDIQELAADIGKEANDQTAIAIRTFNFVRDEIAFGFDLFQTKASDTLRAKYGACWNKSLLLTALLRCNNIEAHFGSIPVKRSFIAPAIGGWHWLANDPYNHCVVHAFIDHRWTILDAVLDKHTYEAFYAPLAVEWGIDWSGEGDVRLYTESVAGEAAKYQDIDAIIDQKVGNTELPKALAAIGNKVINRRLWKQTGFNTAA